MNAPRLNPWDALTWGLPRPLAVGVQGVVADRPDGFYISFIAADEEGCGDVGRYLDSLPRDRRIVVPLVMSLRLAGMLERRGFERVDDWPNYVREPGP